jgi:hypothetical protein
MSPTPRGRHVARSLKRDAETLPDQRVAIVDLPRVMREIIRDLLSDEQGLDLVVEAVADVDLSGLVDATRADVLVMSLRDAALPDAASRVLESHPRVRLLGVVADGRDAILYELRPHHRSLGDVSPTALVAALRGDHHEPPSLLGAGTGT